MPLSNYTHAALLDALFGNTSDLGALASEPTIYVGLSSTTPAQDGSSVTEPSGAAYARVSTASSDWTAATAADPSVVTNANPIDFATATADWASGSDLTHLVLFDAATSGNLLGFGALTTAKPVLDGDTASFAAGDLQVDIGS